MVNEEGKRRPTAKITLSVGLNISNGYEKIGLRVNSTCVCSTLSLVTIYGRTTDQIVKWKALICERPTIISTPAE